LRHWRAWLVPLTALVLMAGLAIGGADRQVFLWLNALGPATADAPWANVTIVGDTLVAFALCLPLWRRRPDVLWALVIAALLAAAWSRGLKPLVDEPRPPAVLGDAVHVIGPAFRSDSFPSGHATAAFAIAGLYVIGLRLRAAAILVLAVAFLTAISRAVVGVHWPNDIAGGMLGGWLAAVIGVAVAERTRRFGLHPHVQWAIFAFLAACAAVLAFGPAREYPQAELFQRAIAICCLVAAATRLRRGSDPGQRRHPGL